MTKHPERLLRGPRKPFKDPVIEAQLAAMWKAAGEAPPDPRITEYHNLAHALVVALTARGIKARLENPTGVYLNRPGRPDDPEAYVTTRGALGFFRVFAYRCRPKTIEGLEETVDWLAKLPRRRK